LIGLAAVLFVCSLSAAAWAQDVTPSQKAEFYRLLNKRNALAAKLGQLDRRAAEALKQGEDPVTIHAAQISTQDQLDMMQLRLELLGTRLGLAIPAMPQTRGDGVTATGDLIRTRDLDRGRSRAVEKLRDDCLRMLRSIDFRPFLDS
jgi:hypothetical protein